MRRLMHRKNGATLAELCVVLAVITIISVVVVSFSVMVNERIGISTDKLKAMEDITIVEHFIEGWVNTMLQDREPGDNLEERVTFIVDKRDTHDILIAKRRSDPGNSDMGTFSVSYAYREAGASDVLACKLSATTFDAATNAVVLETVTDISFDVKYYHEGGDTVLDAVHDMPPSHIPTDWILICTVTYQIDMADDTDGTMTYTFTINPYVGNIVTVPEKETTQTEDTTQVEDSNQVQDTTVESSSDEGGNS